MLKNWSLMSCWNPYKRRDHSYNRDLWEVAWACTKNEESSHAS